MALADRIDRAVGTFRTETADADMLVKEAAPNASGQEEKLTKKKVSGRMPVRRILYFRSQMDEVIDWAIDNSSKLRDLMSALPGAGRVIDAKKLRSSGRLRDFSLYLNSRGEFDKLPKHEPGVYEPPFLYLKDFHIYGDSQSQARMLSRFLREECFRCSILLISSPIALIPNGFEDRVSLISAPQLEEKDIAALIHSKLRKEYANYSLHEDDKQLAAFARSFKGLSGRQIEDVLHRVRIDCDCICELAPGLSKAQVAEIREKTDRYIWEIKEENSRKDGALTYLKLSDDACAVGMGAYEEWIGARSESFCNHYPNAPRGVTLVGVPGTGKTLMAKRTAQILECDLVSFNLGMVKNSAYGSSGQNLLAKLALFDSQEPLVVLIDEAEKDLPSTQSRDTHETTRALLGALLTWMNDHKSSVFPIFTSNDISKTNEELFRPGRIDSVFFAGMPWRGELAAILQSNLIDAQQKWLDNRMFFLEGSLADALKACQKEERIHPFCTGIVDAIAALMDKGGSCMQRNLFFTGADIAHLIKEATSRLSEEKLRALREKDPCVSLGDVMPLCKDDLSELQAAMCAVVKGQPFATGERNLPLVAQLYLRCAKDNYALVSSNGKLVEAARAVLQGETPARPSFESAYDRLLYERVIKELPKYKKLFVD